MPAYTTTNQRLTNARNQTTSRLQAARNAGTPRVQSARDALAQRRASVPMPRDRPGVVSGVPLGDQLQAARETLARQQALSSGSSGNTLSAANTTPTGFAAAANQSPTGFGQTGQPLNPNGVNQQTGAGSNFQNAFTGDPAGTTPITGWAQQMGLTGLGLDAMQREPADIIAALIGGQNAPFTPLYGMAEPLADDINALLLLSKYGVPGANETRTASDDVNWMANVFGGLMTPGGWQVDAPGLLANLFGSPEGFGNPLSAFLNSGNADQQVRNALSMLAAVADAGMNPLVAQATLAQAQGQGSNYRRAVEGGLTNLPFTAWLAQQGGL